MCRLWAKYRQPAAKEPRLRKSSAARTAAPAFCCPNIAKTQLWHCPCPWSTSPQTQVRCQSSTSVYRELPKRDRIPAAWYVTDAWARRQSYFLLKCLWDEGSSAWRHIFTLDLFSMLPQETIPNTWISKSQISTATDLTAQQATL